MGGGGGGVRVVFVFWLYKICIYFFLTVQNMHTFFLLKTPFSSNQLTECTDIVSGMNLDQLHFHLMEKLFQHSFYSTTQSPADQISFLSLLLVYECLWLGKAVFTDYEWMNENSYMAHKNCHTKPCVFTLNHSTVCVCVLYCLIIITSILFNVLNSPEASLFSGEPQDWLQTAMASVSSSASPSHVAHTASLISGMKSACSCRQSNGINRLG